MIGVYVIHLMEKLKHAGHYIGSSIDVSNRLTQHHSGHGSPMLRAAQENGIEWIVSNIMPCENEHQARRLEQKIKRSKDDRRYCPICNRKKRTSKN